MTVNLLHMDCMDYMKTCKDNEFDLAIVDPPYRDENQPTKRMREKLKGDMKEFGLKPKADYFRELQRISVNQIIWGGNNFIEHLQNTNCFIFWYKKNPMKSYSDGELAWTSFEKVAKCFEFNYYGNLQGNTKADNKLHPTQKPRELYDWLLKNYAKEGDKILDTHLGSASSAIAAHYGGFDFTGCELDEDYYIAACKRYMDETAQEALF